MVVNVNNNLSDDSLEKQPGAQLGIIRSQKGYRADYVAEKLNLRVQLIERLEADDYVNMPEPVFIKGYLRAYAKLLDCDPEPYVATFNRYHQVQDLKPEPALWQSRRQINKTEHTLRWVTGVIALGVLSAVMMWWHNTNEHDSLFSTPVNKAEVMTQQPIEPDIRLTDLSKMRSLLSSVGHATALETPRE